MDEILAEAAARAIAYLRERGTGEVFPDDTSVLELQRFVEALSEAPTDPAEVLELLDEVGGPATVASTGGRYFGFVTGGSHPVSTAASWLASTWDQNAALGVMSPTAGVLDTVVGAWLIRLFGLPRGAQHQFVSGTSMANSMCLAVARDRLLADAGWDSVGRGLAGSTELRVIVSAAAHSSVTKALGFVGLGRDAVTVVPADDQGRIRVDELPDPGVPSLVVLQAGNVNSGSFDPFDDVADHFAGTPSWIHVDGAFGLWAAASPRRSHLVAGVDRADSWACDMHKWLNVPYDSAVGVIREPADLARTFQVSAPYIPGSVRLEPVDRGPDMSQRARAIETWAVLKSLGSDGVADLVDRSCDHAGRLAASLVAAGFDVHNEVVLNQVLVSIGSDEETEALLAAIQADGRIWCGGSRWQERSVIRISISSWATTADDVDTAIEVFRACAGLAGEE